jgi:hypothetical protein
MSIAIDTNVLVRILVQTRPRQTNAPQRGVWSLRPRRRATKTRGFAVLKRLTASRTAFRFILSATDGRLSILAVVLVEEQA